MSLPASVQSLVQEIARRARPAKIILFGSRARGDQRENSDFDLAVVDRRCSDADWNTLFVDVQDQPFTLYGFDLVEYEKLGAAYQANIAKEGLLLYEQD